MNGKIMISELREMFAGRVGSVSFAMALIERRARPAVTYPTENLTIG